MKAPHHLAGRAERAWRTLVCERFVPLGIRDMIPTGSEAVSGGTVGDVTLATVRAGPQTVLRDAMGIRRGGADHVFLNLQLAGTCEAKQGERTMRLRPGEIGLFDAGAPYQLRFDRAFAQRVLHVPRMLLNERGSSWPLAGATVTGASGAARALRSLLATCTKPCADPRESEALARAAFLLAAAACPVQPPSPGLCATRSRALELIAREYVDPNLTVEVLAKRLNCSLRHLHLAFSGAGKTVADTIWHHRLEGAAQRLQSGSNASIADVGWDCGFRSPSHFSSRFRQAFGVTPRTWRKERCSRDG